jgi:hypothetical protein
MLRARVVEGGRVLEVEAEVEMGVSEVGGEGWAVVEKEELFICGARVRSLVRAWFTSVAIEFFLLCVLLRLRRGRLWSESDRLRRELNVLLRDRAGRAGSETEGQSRYLIQSSTL